LQTDDRELVARFLARRDDEAFRALFRRYSPRLLAMALRLTGGRHADAEDVVQEAWTRAVQRLAGFEWRSSLSTWLQSIVINCARERWRTATWESLDDPDRLETAERGTVRTTHVAVRTAHGTSEAIDLERAIAALPEGYRAVLVLHDVEGYTHLEIAALCGIAEGTSKSQLFHARRALRARLPRVSDEVTRHAR